MLKKILIAVVVIIILPIIIFWRADIPLNELKEEYADEQSRFIEIDGMPVHYKIEGEGEPLVLLHGTAASLHTWDGWTEALQDDFKIIRLDLPAFGLTGPHPEGRYSISYYSTFLKKFLDSQGINSCYLAGNSLGGGIAWNFTVDNPEYVKKLILIDASGYVKEGKSPLIFQLANTPVISNLLRYVTPRFVIRKNVEAVYFDDSKITDQLVERYYELTLREGNRQAFIDRAQAGGKGYNQELIKTIKAPTLIMWGKHDEWIPEEDALRFAADIDESIVSIYDNGGHVPMEEVPEITAADAKAFLNE